MLRIKVGYVELRLFKSMPTIIVRTNGSKGTTFFLHDTIVVFPLLLFIVLPQYGGNRGVDL